MMPFKFIGEHNMRRVLSCIHAFNLHSYQRVIILLLILQAMFIRKSTNVCNRTMVVTLYDLHVVMNT